MQKLLDRSLRSIIRQRREERRDQMHASVRASARGIVKDVEDLIQRFDRLETPWQPPARYLEAAPDAARGSAQVGR